MKKMRTARWMALLAMTISLSGCWFKKKPAIVPVVTPRQQPQAPTPAPPPPQQQETPPPPVVEPAKPTPQPEPQAPVQKPSPAPSTPKRRRPAPQTPPQPQPQEAPTPTTPPAAAVPIPQLGELLTPEKRKQYEEECDQRLRRARAVLTQTSGRTLTPSQTESAGRVRSFIRQAEELRGRDIATALQLARRADLLGQDLSQTLQ